MSEATRILIGSRANPVRFSYAHVFTPKAHDGGDPKYSVSVIIPKSDKAMIKKINTAINAAKKEGIASKWNGKLPPASKLDLCLRDGDEEKPDDEAYADSMYLNAKSASKCGLVNSRKEEIIDAEEFKSGDYGRLTVNFYPYSVSGSKGVAAGLDNIQKLQDGEALGGSRKSAFDDFDDDEDYDGDGLGGDDDDDDDDDIL